MSYLSRAHNQSKHVSAVFTQATRLCSSTIESPKKRYPRPLNSKKSGIDIIQDPLWNKSMAFSISERDRLGLRGLIPPGVRTLEDQVARVITRLRALETDVAKNLFLQELHNRNETLYHRILVDYISEIAPLVYTPTVGVVCQQFGHKFSKPRGMYFSKQDRGEFSTMLHNWPHDDVHVIVVTDGSRILGLGDLGVHGMGIPIGKLALYCAAGGVAPHRVLPIMLDVGTNNKTLLNDPDYIGSKHERLQGAEYWEFLDEFMVSVFDRWPNVVVQFEDFETSKAVPLLNKYRDVYRCFNDDIQGTGCVTLAGVMAAARAAGGSITDMRFMCAGAGSAGLGVCMALVNGMVKAGLSREEAMSRFVVFNSKGALGDYDGKHGDPNKARKIERNPELAPWINRAVSDGSTMMEVMKSFKPTVLLGLSTVPGVFSQELIEAMAQQCEKPIIMPMSNPTNLAECSAEQAYTWTKGKAVVATGSPFSPVIIDGKKHTPSQCNNMYVFPGIGLAASIAGLTTITDDMLYVAALACVNSLNDDDRKEGRTFPDLKRIRDVSFNVAVAVIEEGIAKGMAPKVTAKHLQNEGVHALVKRKMYYPSYVPLL